MFYVFRNKHYFEAAYGHELYLLLILISIVIKEIYLCMCNQCFYQIHKNIYQRTKYINEYNKYIYLLNKYIYQCNKYIDQSSAGSWCSDVHLQVNKDMKHLFS